MVMEEVESNPNLVLLLSVFVRVKKKKKKKKIIKKKLKKIKKKKKKKKKKKMHVRTFQTEVLY